MTELERALTALAPEIDWPATPQPSLALEPRRGRRPRRLVLVLVAALIAVVVAFGVAPARSAILRFLHLGGVSIERVQTLPRAQEESLSAALGTPITPDEAQAILGQPMRLPDAADGAQLYQQNGIVSALLGTPQPVLLSELPDDGIVMKKIVGTSTAIVPVMIAPGLVGFWLSGGPHVVVLPDAPARLAGNVLLWSKGGLTYRLEGHALDKSLALRIARGLPG